MNSLCDKCNSDCVDYWLVLCSKCESQFQDDTNRLRELGRLAGELVFFSQPDPNFSDCRLVAWKENYAKAFDNLKKWVEEHPLYTKPGWLPGGKMTPEDEILELAEQRDFPIESLLVEIKTLRGRIKCLEDELLAALKDLNEDHISDAENRLEIVMKKGNK